MVDSTSTMIQVLAPPLSRAEVYMTNNVIKNCMLRQFLLIRRGEIDDTDFLYMRNNTLEDVGATKWMEFSQLTYDIQYNSFLRLFGTDGVSLALLQVPEITLLGEAIISNNIFDNPTMSHDIATVSTEYSTCMFISFV